MSFTPSKLTIKPKYATVKPHNSVTHGPAPIYDVCDRTRTQYVIYRSRHAGGGIRDGKMDTNGQTWTPMEMVELRSVFLLSIFVITVIFSGDYVN